MIDIKKLTSAPWFVTGIDTEALIDDAGNQCSMTWLVNDTDTCIVDMLQPNCMDDALFIALARNAFDIMIKRKWWPRPVQGRWGVDMDELVPAELLALRADDPFTIILDADEWYKINVEKIERPVDDGSGTD